MMKLWNQKLQLNLKCVMYLKYTMQQPNIYTICYIECNSIFDKIGMREYPWKRLSIDVPSGTFLYQMITQETNLRKNVEWCHLPTHVT